jgi:hypothetical protein
MWYRLQFSIPSFVLILAVSGLLPVVTAFLSGGAVDYGNYVGAYLFLLCLAVLLPLAFKANTAGGFLPPPAAPFVALKFLYFVLGTLLLFAWPSTRFLNISPPAVPAAMLLLATGFALFAAGIVVSGSRAKTWFPKSLDIVTVRGMGILVALVAGVVWALRLYLATRGVGITHVAGFDVLDRDTQTVATATGEIQYVPISLCVARLCNRALPRGEAPAWQLGLAIVLTSDALYFLWAGARLSLFMEFLIPVWAMWLRLLPTFSRRWYVYTGLVLALAVPVVYAQRTALPYFSARAGENQLQLTRDYLLEEQTQLLQRSAVGTVEGGFGGDTYRLIAVAPVSAVADKILNDRYPLMWGETVKDALLFLVPHWLWPSKPVEVDAKIIIQRHFGLRSGDEVSSIEHGALANFGMVGLCLWMFLFGVLTNRFFAYLLKMAPAHEPVTLCLLYVLPRVFMVEIEINGLLVALRLVPVLFILLMLFSVRHKPLA